MTEYESIKASLFRIYGPAKGQEAFERICTVLSGYSADVEKCTEYFSEDDVVLITYGDSLNEADETPLKTLTNFTSTHLAQTISTIHILPFNPFSSDDGFSVIDFFEVNPELGTWKHIQDLGKHFKLMFDLVLNHISSKSPWFKNYLDEKAGFRELAIEVDPATDLSQVTRPRSLPLLTEFSKGSGAKVHVWTTFSADQIDFNYRSAAVLENMIRILLYYVKQGARIIRMDAIAYLWKEIGTTCIHLPRTHEIVKLFRNVLDHVNPNVMILTETNVPHDENISYFGNGKGEAQMVYNFTLPPLVFHSLVKEDATHLSDWAKTLRTVSDQTTFFNFTASHDGIGVRPLEGILDGSEINVLMDIVMQNGGRISYKDNPDGSKSPYELNITYIDALRKKSDTDSDLHIKRFLVSQAIALILPGVPAVYIHSLLGSQNWTEGVEQTGRARSINREKLRMATIMDQLDDPESFRSKIFSGYVKLIQIRRKQKAFHPNSGFDVLSIHPKAFIIKRYCQSQLLFALTNMAGESITVNLPGRLPREMKDLISDAQVATHTILLEPYQIMWLSD